MKFLPDTPEVRYRFNQAAREEMKLRLLAEIRADMAVCELEGWDRLEFIRELQALLSSLLPKNGVGGMV